MTSRIGDVSRQTSAYTWYLKVGIAVMDLYLKVAIEVMDLCDSDQQADTNCELALRLHCWARLSHPVCRQDERNQLEEGGRRPEGQISFRSSLCD